MDNVISDSLFKNQIQRRKKLWLQTIAVAKAIRRQEPWPGLLPAPARGPQARPLSKGEILTSAQPRTAAWVLLAKIPRPHLRKGKPGAELNTLRLPSHVVAEILMGHHSPCPALEWLPTGQQEPDDVYCYSQLEKTVAKWRIPDRFTLGPIYVLKSAFLRGILLYQENMRLTILKIIKKNFMCWMPLYEQNPEKKIKIQYISQIYTNKKKNPEKSQV